MSNPLRRTPETIRERLLQSMPVGTSKEEVLEVIRENEWELIHANDNGGVAMANIVEGGSWEESIGEQSIRAILGRYGIRPVRYLVEAWWAFDENGELIDVFVRRTTTFR